MSLNIFQIWDNIGRITPFAVKRDNWDIRFYTVVEKIECDQLLYGKAYGYPTIEGVYSSHYEYNSNWRKEKIIPCCGCYQWSLVTNVDLKKYKEGLKATEKTITAAYAINSRFFFGKYKNKTIEEVFKINPNYIEWAIINMEKFFLTPEAFTHLNNLKPNFEFNTLSRFTNSEKVNKHKD